MSYKIEHINRPSGQLLGWLWKFYLKRHTPKILVALVFMSLQGGMLGVLSYLIGPMFDDVFLEKDRDALIYLGLVILAVFSVRGISGFIQRLIMVSVGERIKLQLQNDLMGHVLTLDTMFFEANPPGNLMERILGDSNSVKSIWTGYIAPGIRDVISLASLIYVAVSIDWLWTIVTCAGIPLLVVPIIMVQRLTRESSKEQRSAASDTSVRLNEIFHGIHAIKLNIQESRQIGRFLQAAIRHRRATIRATAGHAGVPALVDIVAGIGFLGMLMLGGSEVISGEKTVGQFMSFFTATVLLFDPLKRLGSFAPAWQMTKVALERIYVLTEMHPSIKVPAKPAPPPPDIQNADIEFDDVKFNYDELPVFNGLSFKALSGQKTALVGPSGAGKTTTFNLLTRILDPQSGRIVIGGINTNQMDLVGLRNLFAVVAQDTGIFDESIRDNILLGRPGASNEEVRQAAEAAYVTTFSDRVPDGLDAPCGPRGSNLSGGQRQRVAIARALLRNAPILLLDEPTSALDSNSEQLIQKAIDSLSADRTILIIAHRLATIQDADRIIVINDGKVIEQGTHDELMSHGSLYAALNWSQHKAT